MNILNARFAVAIGLCFLAGCASAATEEKTEAQGAAYTSVIPQDACVQASFARVGDRIQGLAIDLCTGAPVSTTMFVHNNAWRGGRVFGYGGCEVWAGASMWCSPNVDVTVELNGVTYSGTYGFDVDALAGGQVGYFDADQIDVASSTGAYVQNVYPFDETFPAQ